MTTLEPPVAETAFHRRESLHQEAERIAVPNFDWIAAPIDGIAAALSALTHPHPHHPHAEPPTG
jgi:hypothetical protein